MQLLVEKLVSNSLANISTNLYDQYQLLTNDIRP